MGFFGRGRERELEKQLHYADNKTKRLEHDVAAEQRISEAYRNDLRKAQARIKELDPPPPTTRQIAKETIDAYLKLSNPTANQTQQASLAQTILSRR